MNNWLDNSATNMQGMGANNFNSINPRMNFGFQQI